MALNIFENHLLIYHHHFINKISSPIVFLSQEICYLSILLHYQLDFYSNTKKPKVYKKALYFRKSFLPNYLQASKYLLLHLINLLKNSSFF